MTRIALLVSFLMTVPAVAQARNLLRPGEKAPNFTMKDSKGKSFSLKSFTNRILVFWYEGKNSKEQNRWIKDKLKVMRDSGKLGKNYRSVGFANYQETFVANAIITWVIKREIKKTGATILCDKTGKMMKLWGYRNGRSNIIVLDANRTVRWSTSGPLSRKVGKRLIRLIKRLQR